VSNVNTDGVVLGNRC